MRITNKEQITQKRPETQKEKLQHLRASVQKLKTEFVGLDSILDQLQESIISWYITPEVIERPVVINLWGMTGTGKTSVVRRLLEELFLQSDTIFFDCGQASNEYQGTSITDKICEMFNSDEYGGSEKNNMVFVFDEFQYARTINEEGTELVKSTLRPIWNLIDSGILNYTEFNYNVARFTNFVEDMTQFCAEFSGRPIQNGKLTGQAAEELLDRLGNFWYDEDGYIGHLERKNSAENTTHEVRVLPDYLRRTFIRALDYVEKGWGFSEAAELDKIRDLNIYIQKLIDIKRVVIAPKEIDCTKSLIFILGNLDEAFVCQDDLNPDMNADLYNDITSGVTVNDIKTSLKKRFRAEQIGRLGNNMIIYPTLREEHFEKIIDKEVKRIFDKFYLTSGISLNLTDDMRRLVYAEGVYPTQGVRPIFSTIGSLVTPLLSDILLHSEKETKEVIIGLKEGTDLTFRCPRVTLEILMGDSGKFEKEIPLVLGALRDPENRELRYLTGTHEAAHSIIYTYLTGEFPTAIIGVSSSGGGFMSKSIKPYGDLDTDTYEEAKKKIMTCLAGYVAERMLFDHDKCSTGCTSDIEQAWDIISRLVYEEGYDLPVRFSADRKLDQNTPDGMVDSTIFTVPIIKPENAKESTQYLLNKLYTETEEILNSEKVLLKKMGIELGEKGVMSIDRFKELINQYSAIMTLEGLEKEKEDIKNYYIDILKSED